THNKAFYVNIVAFGVIIILGFGGMYWFSSQKTEIPPPSGGATPANSGNVKTALSPEIEAVLSQKMMTVEALAKDPIILKEVALINEKNKNLTSAEITALDNKWRASKGIDDFIKPFLTNKTAVQLFAFQEKNPGFPEIFVTDKYGLNVGQTDKTSDYYQADEDWWVNAYANGIGKSYHGAIEFDDSAQSEAISIYVPIKDPSSSAVVGVIKAVLSIAAIKSAL
ncbi:MAG: hypothetical protein Q7S12_03025, partial [bacterium]|nr:hypothetical protein [bacterium]